MPAAIARREGMRICPGEGRPIHVLGDEIIVKISSRDTAGKFTVFEGRTRPKSGPPLHVHYTQDEWWLVLEGEYLFEVDGRPIVARAGDTVFAPRGSRHTFQNIGETIGRVMTTAVPGGLDTFFEELEQIVPRGAALDPKQVLPLFNRYDLALLGPPIARR
jgi:mannose-6-phosphate isomerase-like protein (cupin superfamily)